MQIIQQRVDKGLRLIENAKCFSDEPDNPSIQVMDDIFLHFEVRRFVVPAHRNVRDIFKKPLIIFLQKSAQPPHENSQELL
jgi:hypothetical protein